MKRWKLTMMCAAMGLSLLVLGCEPAPSTDEPNTTDTEQQDKNRYFDASDFDIDIDVPSDAGFFPDRYKCSAKDIITKKIYSAKGSTTAKASQKAREVCEARSESACVSAGRCIDTLTELE